MPSSADFTLKNPIIWKIRSAWVVGLFLVLIVGLLYHSSITYMVKIWLTNENYGHGLFVPFISMYFFWNLRNQVNFLGSTGSWYGVLIIFVAICLYIIGELATLFIFLNFSFWVMLIGIFVSFFGLSSTKQAWFPLVFLLFMIPLPQFIFQGLSQTLQLISSTVGVTLLQFLGVTAFQEGNVIDLGPLQLQVAEACSGIRYLFPLMALAFLCSYLYQEKYWKRACLFLSSIPISIALNGFRIGLIGVLVELYGKNQAEGFYHFFEGWILFVFSFGLLLGVAWGLSYIGKRRCCTPHSSLFELNNPNVDDKQKDLPIENNQGYSFLPSPVVASVALLFPTMIFSLQLTSREEYLPQRQAFLDFPRVIGSWEGTSFPMEKIFLDTLKLTDYFLADYYATGKSPINLYIAYYTSQKKGQSAHSPRSCIPGDGWEITSLQPLTIANGEKTSNAVNANLVTIQKGNRQQLVIYWFQQRGRSVANEYLVKGYLLWDALFRNRTDGGLIRLVADMKPGTNVQDVQRDLLQFSKLIQQEIPAYIPN